MTVYHMNPASVGYQMNYNGGGSDVGSFSDANGFVAKFSPGGAIQWCTLLGGPNYTRIYGLRVDSSGNVYVCGRTGKSLATTTGVIQPNWAGGANDSSYGPENGFVAKFNPNGGLLWMTYVGTGDLLRDITIASDESYIVVPLSYHGHGTHAGNDANCPWGVAALASAYQDAPTAQICSGIVKISADGTSAPYATYLGGNDTVGMEACVQIDSSGCVYLQVWTEATDLTVTAGCRAWGGGTADIYVCKFSADLSTLLWGTYLGGSGDEYNSTHNLALDGLGGIFSTCGGGSTNYPTTSGAYMESYPTGAAASACITKLDVDDGTILASTYFMGTSGGPGGVDGTRVDESGNLWFCMGPTCTDMPHTADAIQHTNSGNSDGAIICLSNDLTTLLYSTYFGGDDYDYFRDLAINSDGSKVLCVGMSDGGTYPTHDNWQSAYGGDIPGDPGYGTGSGDAVITLIDLTGDPTTLVFSSFIGGTHWDMGRAAAIDNNGFCYIAGGTHSHDFPTHAR